MLNAPTFCAAPAATACLPPEAAPAFAACCQPPQMHVPLLARPALAQAIANSPAPITLLCAPPGSGKTTALLQHYRHLRASHCAVRWLSLDSAHNHTALLQQHLHRLLAPSVDHSALHVCIDGLEQLHTLQARHMALQALLQLPATVRVYTTDHLLQHPHWHQAQLRGQLHVIEAAQLRLSDEEAAQLLGDACPPNMAAQLNQRLQGWVAGLRLLQPCLPAAALWLQDIHGQRLLPAPLAHYYEDMVCAPLPPSTLQALMELATLERFRSELFAALPQPPCDWAMVEQLLRGGWFLQPALDAPAWLHVQPALGQHLRQRLQRLQPSRYAQLRHFAATWHAQQGFAQEAMRHAVQLHSPHAPHIMEQAGAIAVDLGEGPDVVLDPPLPPERAAELPLVMLGQIYHRFRQGRVLEARSLFDAACTYTQHFSRIHNPQLLPDVRGWHCLLSVVLITTEDRPIDPQHISALEDQYHAQAHRNPVLAASLASVLAYIWLQEGLYSKAATICGMALALHRPDSRVKVRLFLRLHQASAAIALSTLDKADSYLQDGLRLAHTEFAPHSYEVQTLHLMQALVAFERNDWARAQQLLQPALGQLATVYGWTQLYADVFTMATHMAAYHGDLATVEHLLQDAQQLARERQLPRLLNLLHIIHLRALTHTHAWAAAQSVVESAAFTALLQPSSANALAHSTQVPALLAAAQLSMDLGRAPTTLQYLEQLPAHWMHTADQRLHFHFHVLNMRTAYHLRRYKAAAEHWQAAVHLARMAGLLRLAWQERQHLTHLMAVLPRTRRSPLPSDLQHWLQQALTPPTTQAAHEAPAEPQLAPPAPPRPTAAAPQQPLLLSPRESEILALMAQGCINKEIAKQLDISEGTVKTHRKRIYEKLDVRSRSQALQKAKDWLLL